MCPNFAGGGVTAMTDNSTDAAPDRIEVTYKGQTYRRVAVRPHIRADGSETRFAVWQSNCPTCGEKFEITTSTLRKLREPNGAARDTRRRGGRSCSMRTLNEGIQLLRVLSASGLTWVAPARWLCPATKFY
jgi:hypothetical protein